MFKKFILVFVLLLSFSNVSFAEDNSNNLLFLGEGKGISYYAMIDSIKEYEDRINVVIIAKDVPSKKYTVFGTVIWDREMKYQVIKGVVMDLEGNVITKIDCPLPMNSYEKGTIFDELSKYIRNGGNK